MTVELLWFLLVLKLENSEDWDSKATMSNFIELIQMNECRSSILSVQGRCSLSYVISSPFNKISWK